MENNNKYKLNDMGERDSLDERIVTKMIRQVETLSNKYSKLLVVRIDLHVLGDVWLNNSKSIDKLLKNITVIPHLILLFSVLDGDRPF
ncbi:hypothetical protein [Aeromonas caviae]|uniref:hypothetical protein n=1 Tax=Aeromonas caviae TaxID=648 RepID=UPI002F412FCF